jgi:hypothetical protein
MCGGGYAARRRAPVLIFGLRPRCDLAAEKSEGPNPYEGIALEMIWRLSAGHSHRRTSDGKAVALKLQTDILLLTCRALLYSVAARQLK